MRKTRLFLQTTLIRRHKERAQLTLLTMYISNEKPNSKHSCVLSKTMIKHLAHI